MSPGRRVCRRSKVALLPRRPKQRCEAHRGRHSSCQILVRLAGADNKKRASDPYRAATTSYRCCLPALTEFRGSWPYGTCPLPAQRKGYAMVPDARRNCDEPFAVARDRVSSTRCPQRPHRSRFVHRRAVSRMQPSHREAASAAAGLAVDVRHVSRFDIGSVFELSE